MTDHLVRVFRDDDGEIDQQRLAVWGGTEWVELEAEGVHVIDTPMGPLASVTLSCHVGHDLSTPEFAKRRGRKPAVDPGPPCALCGERLAEHAPSSHAFMERRVPMGDFERDANEQAPPARGEEKSPSTHSEPAAPALPKWGDETKRIRWFTITTTDGKVFPNNSTDVAGPDSNAAEYLRSRWNRMAVGIAGRQVAKIELQPNGRVGTDRPDIAPPPGVSASSHVDHDDEDHVG